MKMLTANNSNLFSKTRETSNFTNFLKGFQHNNLQCKIILWCMTLLIFIQNSLSDVAPVYKNSRVEGYLTNKSMKFYSTRIANSSKDLQIRAAPKEGTLSSPYIFASLTSNPSNAETAEYYSVQAGENYVVIPKDKLETDKFAYFTVYCETECFYTVEVKYDDELLMELDNYFSFLLEADSDLLIKFRSNQVGFELNIYSPQMTKFKAYLQKHKVPSSSDTITLYPTFIGGFGVEITPTHKGWCKECDYYLLIVAEDSDTIVNKSEVIVSLTRLDKYEVLDERFPAFNVVSYDNRRCYVFTASNTAMIDNVITTLTVFSGSVKLDVNPGKYVDSSKNAKFNYDVPISLVTKHTPTDMNFLDFREIYYCIYGVEDSSYMLKVIMESHTEITQTYNFLIDGVEMPGYLPARNVTRYRIVDFGEPRNTTIVMKTAEGKPRLYGYFCKSIYSCYIDAEMIRNKRFDDNVILQEEYSGDDYLQTVYAPDYTDKCGPNPKANGCGLNAVIFCESQNECIFDISFNFDHSSVILKEK